MSQSLDIPNVIPNDWKRLDTVIRKIKFRLGRDASPTFTSLTLDTLILSKVCMVAAGLNVLRVTGLQTDDVALTGTLRGAYIDVSNGSTAATGTIRGMELKARTEAPGDTGNDVAVLEGLSISADSKGHSVTTMRAAEFILDGSIGGTITEAVGLRIANNLQANKATTSYGLQIYRDSFDYTADISLSLGGLIAGTGIITIPSFTQGSVLFTGSGGVLSQNNSNLFWDNTNNRLGVGVNSGFDPRIGITVSGDVDILHTSTETDDHAFELDINAAGFGDVKAIDIVYVSGNIGAGEDEEAILVNVDESDSGPGDIAALEVLATDVGSAKIFGLEVGINVIPIEQLSGTFGNMAKAENDGVNALTEFTTSDSGGANNIEIFVGNGDTVLIGNTAKFEEIEFIFETFSNPSVKPTFEFSTGGTGFSPFTPADGTNGMRNNGVVLWLDSDIPSWATNTGDNYEIRITRTKGGNLATTPKEDLIQIGTATEYVWDKDGDVNINSLTLATVAAESSDVDKFLVDSSGIIKYRTGAEVLSDIGGQASGSYITALTGEVTASGPGSVAATIANDAVTYAKMQNVSATDKVLGRVTAGAGNVEEIACTAAGRAILDDANAAAQATTLGLGTGDSPQFTGIELGHASDTTITRASAGDLNVEGNLIYRAGGTDVPIADGGTGQSTAQAAIDALSAVSGATDEHVLTKDTASGNAIWKAAAGGADAFTVKVDSGATADYIGAANSDGVLRTGASLSYADGGNFVTINAVQDIQTSATPTFGGIIVANNGTIGQSAGPLIRFDDTNNYLEITGCHVGIGDTTPLQQLSLLFTTANVDGCWIQNLSSTGKSMLRLLNDTGEVGQLSIWGSSSSVPNKTFFEATKDFQITTDGGVETSGTSTFVIQTGGYGASQPTLTISGTGSTSLSVNTQGDNGVYITNSNTGHPARAFVRMINDDGELCQLGIFGSGHTALAHYTVFEATKSFIITTDGGVETGGSSIFYIKVGGWNVSQKRFQIAADGGILMYSLASGTTQANAGAAANELWVDTDDGNTIKLGT